MKNVLTFLVILGTTAANAQAPSGAPRGGGGGGNMRMGAIGRVYGKLVDASSKEPIAYASVAIYSLATKKDSIIGGALTLDNGDFNIESLPLGRVKVRFSFMGFKQKDQMVALTMPDNVELDMGNVAMENTAQNLKEVTVKAEKSTMQMNIDRKVVNVDKNLVASGGTAEDVLKNVPSVTVDMDGKPSLRNAETTVYMDGRPTTLTLNQIPADQIDQVEIITNPSAKFDANLTGGILNLVMKKNKKPGYNGVLNVGAGTSGQRNAMIALNIKQSPIGISLMYNVNARASLNKGYNNREYFNLTPEKYYQQDNVNDFSNIHQMGRLGLDYYVNNRNTLSIGQMAGGGNFNVVGDQTFAGKNSSNANLYSGTRRTDAQNQFRHYTTNMTWKRTYPKKGEELVVDGQYQFSKSVNNSDFTTKNYLANGSANGNPALQQNRGGGSGEHGQIQIDYTNPLSDSSKLEFGGKVFYRQASNFLNLNLYDYSDASYHREANLSSNFLLDDMVNALYANYSNRYKGIGYQAGMRFEQSYFKGKSLNDNTIFTYSYPSASGDNILKSLFPSLYLSKKLDENHEIQLNFSRKVRRAGHMEIMPFIMAADKKSYRIGNPLLRPEFINLAELNYNKQFGEGSNWLSTVYARFIEDPIIQFATIQGDTTRMSFINGDQSTVLGLDNSLRYVLNKSFDISLSANVFQIKIKTQNFANEGWAYNSKATLNYKLPKDFTVQLSGNYESEKVLAQGRVLPMYFADVAVKKTFFKVASLTFSVSDLFDTRAMRQELNIPNQYIQTSQMRRDVRFFKVSFSMPFGKPDASIFKNRKKQQPQQQQQEMDF
jgi:outer membrane receptor protein involved in Fe transport